MIISDGDWKLFDHDFQLGRTIWRYVDGTGKEHYKTSYTADHIVESNLQERNLAASGWKGDWHKVASIPLNEVYDKGLHDAMSGDDWKYMARYLNDSDNRAFRTKEGTV